MLFHFLLDPELIPDPGKRFGSMRIWIHNTGFQCTVPDPHMLKSYTRQKRDKVWDLDNIDYPRSASVPGFGSKLGQNLDTGPNCILIHNTGTESVHYWFVSNSFFFRGLLTEVSTSLTPLSDSLVRENFFIYLVLLMWWSISQTCIENTWN